MAKPKVLHLLREHGETTYCSRRTTTKLPVVSSIEEASCLVCLSITGRDSSKHADWVRARKRIEELERIRRDRAAAKASKK